MCNDFLYRFIPPPGEVEQYQTSLRHLIQNNKVKVSNPGSLNDPFDCQTLFSTFDATIDDFKVFLRSLPLNLSTTEKESILEKISLNPAREAEKLRNHYTQCHNEDLDKYRILCFFKPHETEYPEDELMWAHYAKSHSGFCLQFQKKILTENFSCKKVHYENRYSTFKEIATNNDESLAELILFRKSARWDYENEWRLLCLKTDIVDSYLQLPAEALTGVIFGCKADTLECEKVAQWARHRLGPSLNFFRAKKHPEKYQIIIENEG